MKRYGAELVGTFVLVFAGLGAAVFAGSKIGWLGISLSFGLALLTMVYAIGPISGCHINPAVTIGLAVAGRTKWADVPGYIIAQLIGGISACGTIVAMLIGSTGGYASAAMAAVANGFGDHSPAGFGMAAAFTAEAVLTFLLVFTILGATAPGAPSGFAGIPIGLALGLTNLVGIPITNASINPARSIGPAIYAHGWALQQLWLFFAAPILGGIVAAILYALVREKARA